MEPPPSRCMSGITACVANTWWRRFTATLRSNAVASTSASAWRTSLAALLTSTAIGPMCVRTAAMAACSASSSVRSQCT